MSCLEIIGLRRFAEAWQAVESGTSQEDLNKQFPNSAALEQVITVQVKRAKGEID